jgi:hypothetical protein
MRLSHWPFWWGATALLTSCSGGTTGPTAAVLNVQFSSPTLDDGAVLFTIAGGPVESVAAVGHAVYSARPDANTLRIIVAGDLTSGTIARIRIPDRDQAARYSIRVSDVASRATHVERDPAAYGMSLKE